MVFLVDQASSSTQNTPPSPTQILLDETSLSQSQLINLIRDDIVADWVEVHSFIGRSRN